ncbi:MAG: BrnT family toxin [Campylobacterota bacterium]|nr:BrnT family toxin [Campylobacterota bacterium]
MEFDCLDIEAIVGFEWDDGNIHKNENKHGLKWTAIEEVFFNEPLLIVEDFKHSEKECRCVALGRNDFNDLVTVVFTIRNNHIRVISARAMSKKERIVYERA